jgi:hypothetical protein
MPVPLLIAIVVTGLVLLALVVVLAFGRDPDSRLHPLRVSAIDAGERTSDLAAEFFDWLRIGR